MLRVLFTVNFQGAYDINRTQVNTIIQLKNKGIDTLVLGESSNLIKNLIKDAGIEFINLYPRYKIDFEYITKVNKIIREHKIKTIYFLDSKSMRNILFINKRRFSTVCFFGSKSLHWYDIMSYLTYLSPKIDKIICNSNYVHKCVRAQLLFTNKQKAIKIYEGYDPNWFDDLPAFDYSKFNIPKSSFVVCLAATNMKVKRIKDFLRASYYLSSNRDIHFVVLGYNTRSNDLKKIAKASPIKDKIHLLGFRDDATCLIKGADLYVQTSLSEGFGRAISEAMCFSKPIIMTNAGGCTELVDKSCSFIVPKRDFKSIAKYISKLADDDKLREYMGDNSRKRIENLFNFKDTVYQVYKLLVDMNK